MLILDNPFSKNKQETLQELQKNVKEIYDFNKFIFSFCRLRLFLWLHAR